ncbi:hypothetical protein BDW22DRAFT_431252 [Trametopsis cervina]|nr:hypothetical protein BDW22DRAFT_431252 [Trametopsis cervina]
MAICLCWKGELPKKGGVAFLCSTGRSSADCNPPFPPQSTWSSVSDGVSPRPSPFLLASSSPPFPCRNKDNAWYLATLVGTHYIRPIHDLQVRALTNAPHPPTLSKLLSFHPSTGRTLEYFARDSRLHPPSTTRHLLFLHRIPLNTL